MLDNLIESTTNDPATAVPHVPTDGAAVGPQRGNRRHGLVATVLGLQLLVTGTLSWSAHVDAAPAVLHVSHDANTDASRAGERRDTPGTVERPLTPVAAKTTGRDTPVTIDAPWARATIGASRPGAAYLTVRNGSDAPVVLAGVDVHADVADRASFHRTVTDGAGTSRMEPVDKLTIKARSSIAFEPGGDHVMLNGLREPLIEGQSIVLTLRFSDGTALDVDVPVLAVTARGPREANR